MPDDDEDRAALEEWATTRDPELRRALIQRYRGLARHRAHRFADRGIEREDLEQVAMIGLINALDRFDPARGVALSTYASRTIDGVLKRHFRDLGWAVRVPRGLRDLSVTARRATAELEGELGRSPRPAEIANRVGASVEQVIEALDARSAFRTTSIDVPDQDGDARESPAVGMRDRDLDLAADSVLVRELLAGLPDRERRILELRYYERLTQSEIGERVGLSQMHVSRLLRRSLRELRSRLDPDPVPE